MGDKSAQNILDEIENSKKLPLERVIYGLGIRMVGERTAQFSGGAFRIDGRIEKASVEELQAVNEVGSDRREHRGVLQHRGESQAGRTAARRGPYVDGAKEAARDEACGENVCADWDTSAFHSR